jgi:hypothetical protein
MKKLVVKVAGTRGKANLILDGHHADCGAIHIWEQSKKHLRSLIDDMLAGKPPSIGADTTQLASKAVTAASKRGHVDVQAWAASLASEVDDLND